MFISIFLSIVKDHHMVTYWLCIFRTSSFQHLNTVEVRLTKRNERYFGSLLYRGRKNAKNSARTEPFEHEAREHMVEPFGLRVLSCWSATSSRVPTDDTCTVLTMSCWLVGSLLVVNDRKVTLHLGVKFFFFILYSFILCRYAWVKGLASCRRSETLDYISKSKIALPRRAVTSLLINFDDCGWE